MTPEEIDERSQEAIRRFRANNEDHEAFAELLRLHERFVLRYVARRFQRPPDDQDVVELAQACWVELLERGLDLYEQIPGARFRSWLVLFVRRRFLNARRAARRGAMGRATTLEKDLEVAKAEPRRDVLPADMEGLEKALQHALSEMPAEMREVLRLKNEERLGFREIAAQLGIPRATANDHYRAAKAKLAEVYKRYSG